MVFPPERKDKYVLTNVKVNGGVLEAICHPAPVGNAVRLGSVVDVVKPSKPKVDVFMYVFLLGHVSPREQF